MKVLWFGYMEEIVCNADDLILNLSLNFEPMKRLEHWGDVTMFGGTGNGTSKSTLNMLKALNFGDGWLPITKIGDG